MYNILRNSNLRSDWFEGMFKAVGLLIAVPSGLTGTGEREREREREAFPYQSLLQHNYVHMIVLFCHATLEYSDGGHQNNGSDPRGYAALRTQREAAVICLPSRLVHNMNSIPSIVTM